MSDDLDETGSARVRELMSRAAGEYRPSADLVSGIVSEARRMRRNRRIGASVGGLTAVLSVAVVMVFSVIAPAGPGHGSTNVGPATGPASSGSAATAFESPSPSGAPVNTIINSGGTPVDYGSPYPGSSVPSMTMPGTLISPVGSTVGLTWEVSIDTGTLSNPCIYLLAPIVAGDRPQCEPLHFLPDLSAAGTSSAGDGLLADYVVVLEGFASSPPGASCDLALVMFATRNVADIDITGIWEDNDGLTLNPKGVGEPDDYAAAVVNLGARFTFTSTNGSTSSAYTVSSQVGCPPSSG